MGNIQSKQIQCFSLGKTTSYWLSYKVILIFSGVFLGVPLLAQKPSEKPILLAHVQSGRAELSHQGRRSFLTIHPPQGSAIVLALTHPNQYNEPAYAPLRARKIAEIPGELLIFTDTYASNPGNAQGRCGASQTGERYLHVVSLRKPPEEKLALHLDSCLEEIESRAGTPLFDPTSRTLAVDFESLDGKPQKTVYHLDADNSVKP